MRLRNAPELTTLGSAVVAGDMDKAAMEAAAAAGTPLPAAAAAAAQASIAAGAAARRRLAAFNDFILTATNTGVVAAREQDERTLLARAAATAAADRRAALVRLEAAQATVDRLERAAGAAPAAAAAGAAGAGAGAGAGAQVADGRGPAVQPAPAPSSADALSAAYRTLSRAQVALTALTETRAEANADVRAHAAAHPRPPVGERPPHPSSVRVEGLSAEELEELHGRLINKTRRHTKHSANCLRRVRNGAHSSAAALAAAVSAAAVLDPSAQLELEAVAATGALPPVPDGFACRVHAPHPVHVKTLVVTEVIPKRGGGTYTRVTTHTATNDAIVNTALDVLQGLCLSNHDCRIVCDPNDSGRYLCKYVTAVY